MITIKVTDGKQFTGEFPYRLLGPRAGSPDANVPHDSTGKPSASDDTAETSHEGQEKR